MSTPPRPRRATHPVAASGEVARETSQATAGLVVLFGEGVTVPAVLTLLVDRPVAARFAINTIRAQPKAGATALDAFDPAAVSAALAPYRGGRAIVLGYPPRGTVKLTQSAAQTYLTSGEEWLGVLRQELSRLHIGVTTMAMESGRGAIRQGHVFGRAAEEAELAAGRIVQGRSLLLRTRATLGVFQLDDPHGVDWLSGDPYATLKRLRGQRTGSYGYLRACSIHYGPSASPILTQAHLAAARGAGLLGLFVDSAGASLDLLGTLDRAGLSDAGHQLFGRLFVHGF